MELLKQRLEDDDNNISLFVVSNEIVRWLVVCYLFEKQKKRKKKKDKKKTV
eukprot:m.6451 g.6451  ORF g.6451 m.6451 type:complete len:51 (+) comp2597_c0_seq1:691-843(+)